MSMESLYADADAARNAWSGLIEILNRGAADFARERPMLGSISLQAFRRRVDLALELLDSIRPTDPTAPSALVLGAREGELQPQLQLLSQASEAAGSQLRANLREGAVIRDGNDAFALQLFDLADSNYANIDITANFKQLRGAVNQLIAALGSVVPLCKADGISDLSARVEALGEVVRQVDGLRVQSSQSATASIEMAEKATQAERAARELLAQLEPIVAGVREQQQKTTADASSVTTLVEQIKTIGASAGTLEAQIDSYRAKFEAFQSDLDGRNQEFVQYQADAATAKQKNTSREVEIDRLTTLADAMISGSTTAGLATSLEKTRARYEERMNSARWGFIASVAFLVVSALPLAAHLLPGLLGDWFPKVPEGAHSSWYGVLGKVLLMVPATWLTGFFTKSFADFFHLEREYAHKAALAMSVDGFKRQAPKYEEEITAEVFLEIRNNPARGKEVEPASHPLYDVLAKVVGKATDSKKAG
jgi:hypothetical protein